jgi:DNA adenine methylase
MNPVVRWAGSKRALVPALTKYWNQTNGRYIEPFCGSGCLFFAVEPDHGILGDINFELITTYRALRADPVRVIECLLRLPVTKSTYYRLRAINPLELSDCEIAARFLLLNRLCFNGIYRTNRSGHFNVPFATPKRKVKFDPTLLIQASNLLKGATLLEGDFEATLASAEAGDFVYLDPPYVLSQRRMFSEYHAGTFAACDLQRLRSALFELDRAGIAFVISYADSAEGRTLVSGWNSRRVRARRNVAGFAGHRRFAYEVLASNLELN